MSNKKEEFDKTVTVEVSPLDNYTILKLASERYPDMMVGDFVENIKHNRLSIILVNGMYFDENEILTKAMGALSLEDKQYKKETIKNGN